ncbi:hypothetical protein FEM48_Zijuj07G0030100 [Ziziphus jujuba var. spinosa]|uniref:Uncharacterized protein n=1 Tax=Ziziphus jujuba var. spinosa TaxID=714518 RepID=A0A978V228_ZIZJJ|nr:hypothetical protein FEM48_Zijuj07G0030100 [Ziziphus jujuba var. spinosa]
MTFPKLFIVTTAIILLIFSAVATAMLQDAKLNLNLGRRVLSVANQRPHHQHDSDLYRAPPYDGTQDPPSPGGFVPPAG